MFCSEVEREFGKLFSKGRGSGIGTKSKYSDSEFNMLVEDIRDGVLVSNCSKGFLGRGLGHVLGKGLDMYLAWKQIICCTYLSSSFYFRTLLVYAQIHPNVEQIMLLGS
jgi:hypothetical protein